MLSSCLAKKWIESSWTNDLLTILNVPSMNSVLSVERYLSCSSLATFYDDISTVKLRWSVGADVVSVYLKKEKRQIY
jgi:hypothetical protein